MRNKSRILNEDGAEQGNVEIGEKGFPRKPERANLFERLLFRKHRYHKCETVVDCELQGAEMCDNVGVERVCVCRCVCVCVCVCV